MDTRSAPLTILAEGTYEGYLESLILKLAALAKTFLDIGANAGFYSISAAIANPGLSVHAFEPNPVVAKVLHRNAIRNSVDGQVNIHVLGLSEASGTSNFFVPAFTGTGGGSLMDLHPEEEKLEEIKVQLETLDSLSLSGVGLIKIDVEGNEYSTVKGGLSLIESQKPTIVIELLRKWMKPFGKHPQDVVRLLAPLGYSCLAVGEEGLREVSEISDSTSETNFLFVHDSSKNQILKQLQK
jgi:FkbM family methyltransferase